MFKNSYIIKLSKYKNFDFNNNNYENGENGLYLNPKNINFVSLSILKEDGIIN